MAQKTVRKPVKKTSQVEVISIDECKQLVSKYEFTEDQILLIRNAMTGIVNTILNSYIDNFE